MKLDIKQLEDNKFEARVVGEEWMKLYNEYYEMIFLNLTSSIKMDGFRQGTIPSIILELKYPSIVKDTNEQSMFAIIQNVYESLRLEKDFETLQIKLDTYQLEESTKDLMVFFHIEHKTKEDSKEAKEVTINEEGNTNKKQQKTKVKKTKENKEETIEEEPKKEKIKDDSVKKERKKTTKKKEE